MPCVCVLVCVRSVSVSECMNDTKDEEFFRSGKSLFFTYRTKLTHFIPTKQTTHK